MPSAAALPRPVRLGVDLGGTKIEVAAPSPDGGFLLRRRVPTPAGYETVVTAVRDLVLAAETELGAAATVGVGIPGSISPSSGLIRNANSTVLNGRTLDRDLSAALGREVRLANDANCFALSEAVDGAGAGHDVVFGVILGTGCGGGVVVGGRILDGRNRIAGEWGHTPLPWPTANDAPLPPCWCGRSGCLEAVLCGPALARSCDGPDARDAAPLPARAAEGDGRAKAALDRHADRLARGLAVVLDVLDPDVVVLGGGLSNMAHLYDQVPPLLARYVFSDACTTPVLPARHGDSSGVRGAAWLWPLPGA